MLLMFLAGLLVRHNWASGGGAHRSTFSPLPCVSSGRPYPPSGWRRPIGRLSVPVTSAANGRVDPELNLSWAPLSLKLYPLLLYHPENVFQSSACIHPYRRLLGWCETIFLYTPQTITRAILFEKSISLKKFCYFGMLTVMRAFFTTQIEWIKKWWSNILRLFTCM